MELLLGEESEVRRTRVKHIQEGEQETWAGWEDGRLVSFFVEHAALRTPADQSNNLPAPSAAGAELGELYIEVDDFDVAEASGDQAKSDLLHAEVEFHLSGLATQQIANAQATYFLHVLAYMIASGETIVLAAIQGQLQPGRLVYTKAVDFAPPQAGRYQLLATVVLSDYNSVGTAVGPKLRVVP